MTAAKAADHAPLASMTGYGRAGFTCDGVSWSLELRSVNGKALDIRCRLPSGAEALEAEIKSLISQRLHRGNVSFSLSANGNGAAGSGWRINHDLLAALVKLTHELGGPDAEPVRPEMLLSVRGVVEPSEGAQAPDPTRLRPQVIAALTEALDHLVAARNAEGERLAVIISGQIDAIESCAVSARQCDSVQPAQRRARLEAQLAELLATRPPISEERMAAELAFQLTRADVREELDRLDAHVAAARALLQKGGPVGRGLDFLSQEFNREANTLCSKASDIELTRIGLSAKGFIDQFREQIQNLE